MLTEKIVQKRVDDLRAWISNHPALAPKEREDLLALDDLILLRLLATQPPSIRRECMADWVK